MRSVAVVFPASICAMIPMFRQRFRGMVRATVSFLCGRFLARGYSACSGPQSEAPTSLPISLRRDQTRDRTYSEWLPAIVRKSAVGFRHAVHVFLLLHGRTA